MNYVERLYWKYPSLAADMSRAKRRVADVRAKLPHAHRGDMMSIAAENCYATNELQGVWNDLIRKAAAEDKVHRIYFGHAVCEAEAGGNHLWYHYGYVNLPVFATHLPYTAAVLQRMAEELGGYVHGFLRPAAGWDYFEVCYPKPAEDKPEAAKQEDPNPEGRLILVGNEKDNQLGLFNDLERRKLSFSETKALLNTRKVYVYSAYLAECVRNLLGCGFEFLPITDRCQGRDDQVLVVTLESATLYSVAK